MSKVALSALVVSAVAACALLATPVEAQATRTWVSGVGDDANPCSRTAPCKTFAGAISKTATAGEINVLDPGGYGGVTITKSITISSESFEAGVLVSGTNAIIVNAPNTSVVVLRGLDIEGLGTGLSGIKFLAGKALYVENCTINNFTQKGIDFVPSSVSAHTAQLHVTNTIVRNNVGVSSGGIMVKPGANTSAIGTIVDTRLENNTFGLRLEDRATVSAVNTTASASAGAGFTAFSAGSASELNLERCTANGNFIGVRSEGAAANVLVGRNSLAGNTTGFLSVTSGAITSFGFNYNSDPGAPTAALVPQ